MSIRKVVIDEVLTGSIASEVGIEEGDIIVSINGQKLSDLIDYRYLCADDNLEVEIQKPDGEVWVCDIEKDFDEELGLRFKQDTFDGIRRCVNKCVFCFVDQMPPGMRESLYVKDDDYRLSFLHGNFVTLTNLSQQDMERIIHMRLSPLYISVHCTDPLVRSEMLGNKKAAKIRLQLEKLADAGIEMHTQIVLCPGVNDGIYLEQTIEYLATLWPAVKSVAIVPVGLTGFRQNLRHLRKFNFEEAELLVELIHNYQKTFLKEIDNPFVYLADEFYILAEKDFPETEFYGDFPQLENGVGLSRLFYDSFYTHEAELPDSLPDIKNVALVTGVSGQKVLMPVVERLNKIKNLRVSLVPVHNRFFGGNVSVTGLLTGRDILETLKDNGKYDEVLLPSVMCKRDEQIFLDGTTPGELENALNTPVRVIDISNEAKHLIEIIQNYV